MKISVFDHGYVELKNIAGPVRRVDQPYDASSIDPALAARMSFDEKGDVDRTKENDLKLVKYLLNHKHNTPIEMIEVWLEMKLPIFVARQFVRHRTCSINEVSARYVKLEPHFYIPEVETVGVKPNSVKQGRLIISGPVSKDIEDFCVGLYAHCQEAYSGYENALDDGIPNELARCFLPLNIYTRWLWKQDLHNMLHFLRLRIDSHAQFEAREYGKAIRTLLITAIPELIELTDIKDI